MLNASLVHAGQRAIESQMTRTANRVEDQYPAIKKIEVRLSIEVEDCDSVEMAWSRSNQFWTCQVAIRILGKCHMGSLASSFPCRSQMTFVKGQHFSAQNSSPGLL